MSRGSETIGRLTDRIERATIIVSVSGGAVGQLVDPDRGR
jgi:hypothetical protein